MNLTDQDIQALIDNELNWEEEKKVYAGIRSDATAKRRYLVLKAQKKLLQNWWQKTSFNH